LLSEAEPGSSYSIASVYERDRKLLEFLEERGMRPGSSLELLARNYDQTLTIKTASGTVSVGQPVAEKVWVSPPAGKQRIRAKSA
jgi:DtxR family Mn-dependent transcriptional regulator